MVDRSLVVERMEVIDDCLARATKLGRMRRDVFAQTPEAYMLAERCLHLAMEAVLDIANHVVSDRDLGSPQTYAEAVDLLAAGRVISRKLAGKLVPWVGFRNLLVHGYLKVDHGRTHDTICKDLGAIRAFLKAIAKLL